MISTSGLRFVRAATCRSSPLQAAIRPITVAANQSALRLAGCRVPDYSIRTQSTVAAQQTAVDVNDFFKIEHPLRCLDETTVQKIKQELLEVDANFDGRLDPDELKLLLRKHAGTFTDEEIVEMGELYYAAKAGGSVPFNRFIEAIDSVAAKQLAAEASGKITEEHLTEEEADLLGIRRDGLEYVNLGKPHAYTEDELNIELTHRKPEGFLDKAAYQSVQAVRFLFDKATGWRMDNIKVDNTMNRVIFLETIAAVPGMVAAVIRHLRSLRQMKTDGGMLQMFLEEANNERMHLLTFVQMKNPGLAFRLTVLLSQFGFGAVFSLAYMISPAFCHRFVGYVEEEACTTYTKIIKAIEDAPEGSEMAKWKTESPPDIAIAYWKLGRDATVQDLFWAVRADEAEHRDVNHLVSSLKDGDQNPFYDPEKKVNVMLTKYVRDIMSRGDKA